jgi:hypothetical protein
LWFKQMADEREDAWIAFKLGGTRVKCYCHMSVNSSTCQCCSSYSLLWLALLCCRSVMQAEQHLHGLQASRCFAHAQLVETCYSPSSA